MFLGRLRVFFKSLSLKYLAIIFVAVILLYGGSLKDYFIADDFNILRYLNDGPFVKKIIENFTGPWLGIRTNNMYRPIFTLFLNLCVLIFKGLPIGYHIVSFLLHCANSILIYLIVRNLSARDNILSLSAGLLFVVFPFHPNAVIWIASLSILAYTFFLLMAFLFYITYRHSLKTAYLLFSLFCFVFSLGFYEAAIVLPLILAAYELILAVRQKRAKIYYLFKIVAIYFIISLVYLYIKLSVTGVFIGEYSFIKLRLLNLFRPETALLILKDLTQDFLVYFLPIQRFFIDNFKKTINLGVLFLCSLYIFYIIAGVFKRGRYILRLFFFSIIWVIIALVPFGFPVAELQFGRYFYLAAAGLALFVSVLVCKILFFSFRSWKSFTVIVVTTLIILSGLPELLRNINIYREASKTNSKIINQIMAIQEKEKSKIIFFADCPQLFNKTDWQSHPFGEATTFVSSPNYFVSSSAFYPPFQERINVYLLPGLNDPEIELLKQNSQRYLTFFWDDKNKLIRKLERDSIFSSEGAGLEKIEIIYPQAGTIMNSDKACFSFRAGSVSKFRLVVLSRINPMVIFLCLNKNGDGVFTWQFPRDMVTFYLNFCPRSRVFWWVEALGDNDRILAMSSLNDFYISER